MPSRPLVLCVDDEPRVLADLVRLLRGWGAEVLTATSGSEALEVLAGSAARPDLVFLDLRMPATAGGELLRALRRDPGLAKVPAVVLTGSPLEVRAAAFLPRPFTAAELRAVYQAFCPGTPPQDGGG